METIKITKKELKETAIDQTFTGRKTKVNCLWFDWKDGEYIEGGVTKRFCGAKYLVAGLNVSKKYVLDYMYQWLTQGVIGYNSNIKVWVAENDTKRKKIPLQFNWVSFY